MTIGPVDHGCDSEDFFMRMRWHGFRATIPVRGCTDNKISSLAKDKRRKCVVARLVRIGTGWSVDGLSLEVKASSTGNSTFDGRDASEGERSPPKVQALPFSSKFCLIRAKCVLVRHMSSSRGLEIDFAEPAMAHVARAAFDLNGFSAEYVELSGAEPYDFRSRGENHYLALHDITLTDGELRVDGLPTLHKKDLRDTITFVPKGCGIEGWCQPQPRTNRFVAMYFDPKAIRDDLAGRYSERDPAPFAYSRDPQLRVTLKKLEAVLRAPHVDELHAESVCLLASLEVFGVMADRQGRLSDRQIAAVTDFVEGHLQATVGLAELAAVAGLSRFHFSRAFKATTGENPHSFVQRRRISRAVTLLAQVDLPIDAIAGAVGYKGTPQFRRAFHDVMGTSPLKYRLQR
ncbi:helix-turn-helix domain-containing protein [Neorhizobium sp. DAR64860/K0K1]|uniref:AraC family transcriptional regulator n=1 Tax=Neorhizobium sp. DAR64860/K0K1 TaxID=3421955 RepID=UPI003D269420